MPQALWREAGQAQAVEHVDQLCPKRAQGLSPGDYIRLAAINRACEPVSKHAMWDWVCRTCLPRLWLEASEAQLTSQQFWEPMDRISPEKAQAIGQQLIAAVWQREQIQLSQVCVREVSALAQRAGGIHVGRDQTDARFRQREPKAGAPNRWCMARSARWS